MNNLLKLKELEIDFPELHSLNSSTCQERYFKIHYPQLYKYIINNTYEYNWSERLYMFYNNLNERPKCPSCGKECKFLNIKYGYGLHCSRKCVNKSPLTKKKKEENSIKKWGVKNPAQAKEIKDKIKQTNLEKYGVENVYQAKEIKDKIKQANLEKYGVEYNLQRIETRDKIKHTCLEKYGVEYISQSNEFKNICKNNSLEKYGVEHPMQSDIVKQNVKKIHKEKYGVEYISQRHDVIKKIANSLRKNHMEKDNNILGFTNDYLQIMKCPHLECNKCKEKYFITPGGIYYDRKRINAELCTRLLPIKSLVSTYELKIRQLLDENNIKYDYNKRNIISNELDIYIPDKKIAIEFNGIYWHNDNEKPINYHIDKYKQCNNLGIQLISIWEDQFINKYDIVKSILLNKLGICKDKIYARNCIIKKVKSNIASNFYSINHIQGKCGASIHYGLFYNNELVSMMSFGKRKIGNNEYEKYELIRYCSKLNTCIIGGASKLFKYFINEYNPKEIISWSNNDISNGNMYKQLGFNICNISNSYWYISKNFKRYHRTNFNKSNLIKKEIISKDDIRTESQIMKDLGYYKIYDTGQTKWIWKNI